MLEYSFEIKYNSGKKHAHVDSLSRNPVYQSTKRDEGKTKKGTNQKPTGFLQPISVGEHYDRISIDLLGPFPKIHCGNRYVITRIDYSTRWAETRAVPAGATQEVAQFLLENIKELQKQRAGYCDRIERSSSGRLPITCDSIRRRQNRGMTPTTGLLNISLGNMC
ncbi:hypothetical protein PR048_015977 [Dryococelus australis]|uniref:Integrase catalytic domain-containing protein n=1 Tax=Dryococelus australis TaxID=614101 RepID=A0ABQ9HIM1_9NEOP|nr:hypothetical protein PR048_015977 [Dryococelus australis]